MISTENKYSQLLDVQKFVRIPSDKMIIDKGLWEDYEAFKKDWEDLPLDNYLQNNSKFRYRRFNYFYYHPSKDILQVMEKVPFFQPAEDNEYAGGINREFPPLKKRTIENKFMLELIKFSFAQTPDAKKKELLDSPWKVEVHLVRVIASAEELGEPTPEGIHRDGGESGFVYLMNRQNAKGGESAVYDNDKNLITRFTLTKPMDTMIFLDPDVMHSVSPIHPIDPTQPAIRDVFLFGFFHEPTLKRPKKRILQNIDYQIS